MPKGDEVAAVRYVLALMLCGCGADFTGTWVGTLSNKYGCSDGSELRDTGSVRWVLADSGDRIEIAPDGTCGTFTARTSSPTTARLDGKSCGSETDASYRYTSRLSSGTLEMDKSGGFIGVAVYFDTTVTRLSNGTQWGTCDAEISGRLTRN